MDFTVFKMVMGTYGAVVSACLAAHLLERRFARRR